MNVEWYEKNRRGGEGIWSLCFWKNIDEIWVDVGLDKCDRGSEVGRTARWIGKQEEAWRREWVKKFVKEVGEQVWWIGLMKKCDEWARWYRCNRCTTYSSASLRTLSFVICFITLFIKSIHQICSPITSQLDIFTEHIRLIFPRSALHIRPGMGNFSTLKHTFYQFQHP